MTYECAPQASKYTTQIIYGPLAPQQPTVSVPNVFNYEKKEWDIITVHFGLKMF